MGNILIQAKTSFNISCEKVRFREEKADPLYRVILEKSSTIKPEESRAKETCTKERSTNNPMKLAKCVK